MGVESFIVWLIIGALAGWLAGVLVKGAGFGLVGNIVIGVIGAFVAGLLLPAIGLNLGTGVVAAIIGRAKSTVHSCGRKRLAQPVRAWSPRAAR